MSKDRRIISSEDFGDAPRYKSSDERGYKRTLEVGVYYDLGGANFFQGTTNNPRGFYLSVTMRERRDEGMFRSERLGIGSGTSYRKFIEPAARFSAKRLTSIVPDPDLVTGMRQQVLSNVARNDAEDAVRYGPPVSAVSKHTAARQASQVG
jgi:hypothetical protein